MIIPGTPKDSSSPLNPPSGFAGVLKGILRVSKADLDAMIAKEQRHKAKKSVRKSKKKR